jgi:hypothetical protein
MMSPRQRLEAQQRTGHAGAPARAEEAAELTLSLLWAMSPFILRAVVGLSTSRER